MYIGSYANTASTHILAGALLVVSLTHTTAEQIVYLAGRGDMSVTISNR